MVKHLFKGKITTNDEVMEFYSISEFEKKLKELDDAGVVYEAQRRSPRKNRRTRQIGVRSC